VLRPNKQTGFKEMKRLILGAAAALLLSAGPVAADGLPSKGRVAAPAAAAGPNWNGFYVGAGIGAGAAVIDYKDSFTEYHDSNPARESYNYSPDYYVYESSGIGGEGIFGTVVLGYDREIRPGWVLGTFVDYDFGSTIRAKETYEEKGFGDDYRNHIKLNNAWSVGARLGYLSSPSTLLYLTGGYTQADFNISGIGTETFDGYFGGAGIETFLRPNWTLKLEYRFTQFNEESFSYYNHGFGTEAFEPSMHSARLVLSYKFGHRD
jgi:outer membrane immunogenic protein